jgi:LysM repeat protein
VVSAPAPQPQSAPVTASAPEQSSPPQPLAPPADTTDMAATSPQTPTGPISSNGAAIAPQTAPLAGPVHMPPPSSHVAGGEHEHGQIYTVKITDSYKKIARSHHVTVAQLKLANHISNNTLHAGQKLVIPASKTVLADAGTTSLDAPETESRLKPTTTAYTTSTMTTDVTSHHHLYTVQRGDTLKKIARKFNTSPAAILGVNSISNPAKLTIGKKLRIPSAESRSAHLTAPAAEPSVSQPTTPSQVQAAPSHMDGESATANGELANFAP